MSEFLKAAHALVAQQVNEEAVEAQQMTLGEYIATLKRFDPAWDISFDYGMYPGEPISYRGYYEQLAFQPSLDKTTIGEALKRAEAGLIHTFEGYKGGLFTMHRATWIWAAGYGDLGRRIIGVEEDVGSVRITTREDEN